MMQDGASALAAALARAEAAERERDEALMYYEEQASFGGKMLTRCATLEAALREIAGMGQRFDAKGTHSKRVVEIARAALAAATPPAEEDC